MSKPTVPPGPCLLMLDFDGTLAPLARRPQDVVAPQGLPGLLTSLGRAGHTVFIVTGRPAASARALIAPADVPVVGLHGAEWPGEPSPTKSAAAAAALQQLRSLRDAFPKLLVEDKGASVAAHWGQVPPDRHEQAAAAVEEVLRPWVQQTRGQQHAMSLLAGHHMLELRLADAGKGRAAQRLIKQHPGLHPVFIGDDLSDEEALAYLSSLDIPTTTIRVGVTAVKTGAAYRLAGPKQVHAFLATLAKLTGRHGVA